VDLRTAGRDLNNKETSYDGRIIHTIDYIYHPLSHTTSMNKEAKEQNQQQLHNQ